MTTPEFTTEQKLAAVIEAQDAGGFPDNTVLLRSMWLSSDKKAVTCSMLHPEFISILEVLLDPDGLRAAYRDGKSHSEALCIEGGEVGLYRLSEAPHAHRMAAHRILDAWLSNGADAAISTAYDLLPKP
jgi:hypothetical protein